MRGPPPAADPWSQNASGAREDAIARMHGGPAARVFAASDGAVQQAFGATPRSVGDGPRGIMTNDVIRVGRLVHDHRGAAQRFGGVRPDARRGSGLDVRRRGGPR